ncbi:MAG: hypothetical protein ABIP39_07155 [Polyangiaceae bacterium]
MEQLHDFLNSLSDMDSGWWPFLFMRPSPETRMCNRRVAAIAGLYGVFAAMFANAVIAVSGESVRLSVVTFPVLTTLVFFVMFRITFAWSWNARAKRLSEPAA